MRTILGPAATALGRRGLAVERAALVTLRRDAYAEPPGTTLSLAIGERTTYRPGAWLLDTFERDTLGDAYPAWGGTAGLLLEAGGVTAAVGPVGMVTHPLALPRDAWAACTIGALSGDAEVGLLLRAAVDTADGYWIAATPTLTVIERLDAGVATSLASVATPWRAGEMLRAVWGWDRLSVYRDAILVAQVTEAARLLAGQAGMVARRGDGAASAALTSFVGGAARQEWLGAGLDLGDVQRTLGQPATFEVTVSNVAPMGGADRFAALLRHGLNTDGTYDLDRGEVRVLTVVDGQSPPLTAGLGVIDGPAEVTEDRVRLACRGRDAFLTPQLAAGVVTYLPGPPAAGLTPLPPDPCAAADPPVIEAGPVPPEPPEPPDPPPTNPPRIDGAGPEAPPVGQSEGDGGGGSAGGGGGVTAALLGTWRIVWDYTLEATGPGGTDVYVGSTTVTQIPDAAHAAAGYTDHDFFHPAVTPTLGTGTATAPGHVQETWIYRGPDVAGTHLVPNTHLPPDPPFSLSGGVFAYWSDTGGMPPTPISCPVTLARYDAAAIQTEADLSALRPANPSGGGAPLPARIETCATWTIPLPFGMTGGTVEAPHIPTNMFAGPQLLRLELQTTAWATGGSATRQVMVELASYTYMGSASGDPTGFRVSVVDGTTPLGLTLGT